AARRRRCVYSPPRELLHESPELLPTLLKAPELVVRRARGREQHDVPRRPGVRRSGESGGERALDDVRDVRCLEGGGQVTRRLADQVRAVARSTRGRKRVVWLGLPAATEDQMLAQPGERRNRAQSG